MKIYAKKALLDSCWQQDIVVQVESGIIRSIDAGVSGDIKADILAPGLIDNHNHGGYGCNVMTSDPDKFNDWLTDLARKGTTGVTAGLYTAPLANMKTALQKTAQAEKMWQSGEIKGARLLGVHLEGPFVSPEKPGTGAMAENAIARPSIHLYDELVAGYENLICEISLAPERDDDFRLTRYLRQKGVKVLAGHTNAEYDLAIGAFANGIGAICHFFNASVGIHHRSPGVLTAALLNPEIYCEAICDFAHVHPAALQLLWRLKGRERFMIVSDAVTMTGLPDCEYMDGDDLIIQKDGVNRLASGGLAGGAAYVLDGVRNLVSIGISLADGLIMGSRTPARWLGREDLGRIQVGCRADLLALNQELDIIFSLVAGRLFGTGYE